MIPSLLIVRSGKKLFFTLTWKRKLKIGGNEGCDVIVNHGQHPQQTVIGPRCKTPDAAIAAKSSNNLLLPVYRYDTESIRVRLVPLRTPFFILLAVCLSAAAITFMKTWQTHSFTSQDWTPVVLPAEGVYGFCRGDRNHSQGVLFTFSAGGSQSYRMIFRVGGRGDGTSIQVSLNGHAVGEPFLLPSGWGEQRSVPLPLAHVKKGVNRLLVSPENVPEEPLSWGISEVDVLPLGDAGSGWAGSPVFTPGEIMGALEKRDVKGRELARYYDAVRRLDGNLPSQNPDLDKGEMLRTIEQRMKGVLLKAAFDIRSQRMAGDLSAVQGLLDEMESWIPPDWNEGWEIYNEHCRR